MNPNAPEELDQERDRATQLLSAPVLPSVRAKGIVSLFRDQVRSATFPEELEGVYSALEALIQSAIILHANKEVDLRRAAVTDSQRAKDFLHNVACGPWYRPEDRELSLGNTHLLRVERNGCQYYRLGNHEPEERVVCWARIYPPRVVRDGAGCPQLDTRQGDRITHWAKIYPPRPTVSTSPCLECDRK